MGDDYDHEVQMQHSHAYRVQFEPREFSEPEPQEVGDDEGRGA